MFIHIYLTTGIISIIVSTFFSQILIGHSVSKNNFFNTVKEKSIMYGKIYANY